MYSIHYIALENKFPVQAVTLATLAKQADTFSGACTSTSSDRSSHVYKHLQASEFCRTSCNLDCFKILDAALTRH